ncbi:MAG: transposase [Chloroflexi bacterium]|nr:transposase [Chloroflexota bacterium]
MEPPVPPATLPAVARVCRPVRNQVEWIERDLDPDSSGLAPDHPARAIWAMVEGMDLDAFYADIKAVLDRPGSPTSAPPVLLALWVYATVEGVGKARELDRLCHQHDAYRWLRGGVPVNYHLTQIVGCLLASGIIRPNQVAQDGMRVRASAGAASFRREETLERCLAEAKAQVERLAQEREHADPGVSKRQQAARERAAREREQRVIQALAYLPQVQAAKERQERTLATGKREKVTAPRVSTTDPEARVMKMPDGGFRPAYNVELATVKGAGQAHGIIVGVSVITEGTDAGQAVPMEAQVHQRTGIHPQDYLVDGGFASRHDITTLERQGTTVYAPVRLPRNKPEAERYLPREGDSPEVAAWRERMATAEAKAVYRTRGALAEWANAQVRHLGVSQFTVRGGAKVTAVMLLIAVTHNLLRWLAWAT